MYGAQARRLGRPDLMCGRGWEGIDWTQVDERFFPLPNNQQSQPPLDATSASTCSCTTTARSCFFSRWFDDDGRSQAKVETKMTCGIARRRCSRVAVFLAVLASHNHAPQGSKREYQTRESAGHQCIMIQVGTSSISSIEADALGFQDMTGTPQ